MTRKEAMSATIILVALTAGCTKVDRNRVALGLCSRTTWCTATEQRPESAGSPQVRTMEERQGQRIINPQR